MTNAGIYVILWGMARQGQGDVKVTVLLPREEVELFERRFPSHGSKTWFFREALTRFNETFDIDPNEVIGETVANIDLTD